MLLKSRASLTCFRACFFPGRAKDLSALRVCSVESVSLYNFVNDTNVRVLFLMYSVSFIYKLYMFRTSPGQSSSQSILLPQHDPTSFTPSRVPDCQLNRYVRRYINKIIIVLNADLLLFINSFNIIAYLFVCLFLEQQPPAGHGLLIYEFSRSHSRTHHSR